MGVREASARVHAALLAPTGCSAFPAGFPMLDEVTAEYLVTCLVEEAEDLTPEDVRATCTPFLEDAGLDGDDVDACCARLVAALQLEGEMAEIVCEGGQMIRADCHGHEVPAEAAVEQEEPAELAAEVGATPVVRRGQRLSFIGRVIHLANDGINESQLDEV